MVEAVGGDVVVENLDEALAGEGGGIGAGGVGRAEEGVGGLFVEAVEGFGFEGVELGVEAEGGAEGEEDVGVDGVGAGGTDELGGGAGFFPGEVVGPEGVGELGEVVGVVEEVGAVGGEAGGGHEAAAGVVEGAEAAALPVGGGEGFVVEGLGLFPPDVPALADEAAGLGWIGGGGCGGEEGVRRCRGGGRSVQ